MKDTPVIFVCGRRRTGKSASVKIDIAAKPRLLVWDSTGEYGRDLKRIEVVTDRAALVDLLAANKRGPLRVAYQPKKLSYFDWFCRLARAWGRCCVVVEELASVTQPAKAPPGWGDVVRLSAHDQNEVYAITQRPAEADKTVLGNATKIRCFALGRSRDVSYMAAELRMRESELDQLPPLWCYERDTGTQTMKTGKLPWAKPWPKAKKNP